MCQDSLVGLGLRLGAPERTSRSRREAQYYGITTEELRYGYAGRGAALRLRIIMTSLLLHYYIIIASLLYSSLLHHYCIIITY